MPLTDKGFERPTYDDLLEMQIARAQLLFGNDIETSQNTALGKYIRLNVQDLAEVYEILEGVYNARFPNTATGVSLDKLCTFVGISRNPATYAQHRIRFNGVAGEYVPEAFEVSTADGALTYHTYQSYLIGEDGTVVGVVECETAGEAGNVTVGKIDTVVNPDVNVESIEHLGIEVYGEEVENDISLRGRFNETKSGLGYATLEAVKSAILQVPLVEGVAIVENDKDVTVDGVPPHCFESFVLCPSSQDGLVAEAIFKKKPMGIRAVGDISKEVLDKSNVAHTIGFSKTAEIPIYIKMSITVNQYFNADGIDQIKAHIAGYINGLKNDADIYISSIYGYVYKVEGIVNVSSLTISKGGSSYSTADIPISVAEVARIDTANIEVVISA